MMRTGRATAAAVALTMVAGLAAGCASGGSEADEAEDVSTSTTAPGPECPGGGADPGRTEQTIEVDGRTREYLLYVPAGYDGTTAVPLVVNLHGSGSNATEQLEGSSLERVADEVGAIVVAPEAGITQTLADGQVTTTGGVWNIPGVVLTDGSQADPDAPDDVAFLEALVDSVSEELCISTVVATGTSGGGRMSSTLGCVSDRFDVIAPVAGVRLPAECDPAHPVDLVAFHGTEDKVNPYGGGGPAYWGAQSVPDAAAAWAELQGCAPTAEVTQVSPAVSRSSWTGCAGDVSVTLYTVEGGGHTWPGGLDVAATRPAFAEIVGVTTQEIDAGQLILEVAQPS